MPTADYRGKTALIMGLGLHGGGAGAARFFARAGSRVVVTDLKSMRELGPSLRVLSRWRRRIVYHLGGHRKSDFTRADIVVQNPGVSDDSRYLDAARRAGAEVLSDVEIFFRSCPAPIIGITGTKGKTTATTLLGSFLKRGRRCGVWVGGNISISVLDFLPRVRPGDLVVLELSSFQLDALARSRVSPCAALITNLFPDHLNRYRSYGAYIRSKTGIFRFQKPGDLLFIPAGDRALVRLSKRAPSRVIRVDAERTLAGLESVISPAIPRYHRSTIALAVAAARWFGVRNSVIRGTLARFRGIAGRMERVARIRGVTFINDTTATNPIAAAAAIRETKRSLGRSAKLHVIAGGWDKKLPVAEFARQLLRSAATVVLLPGEASVKMAAALKRLTRARPVSQRPVVMSVRSMPQAVRSAWDNARPGDAVLLAPGAASFGLFLHEFHRGEEFVRALKGLRGPVRPAP